jgi:hypothetical protein
MRPVAVMSNVTRSMPLLSNEHLSSGENFFAAKPVTPLVTYQQNHRRPHSDNCGTNGSAPRPDTFGRYWAAHKVEPSHGLRLSRGR